MTTDDSDAAITRAAIALYLELHRKPELSGAEVTTAERLTSWLRADGYQVATGVGGHGVVGLLSRGVRSAADGPMVMIRAELDALPIQERTGLSYASTAAGVMHACGHDLHVAAVAGAARTLAAAEGVAGHRDGRRATGRGDPAGRPGDARRRAVRAVRPANRAAGPAHRADAGRHGGARPRAGAGRQRLAGGRHPRPGWSRVGAAPDDRPGRHRRRGRAPAADHRVPGVLAGRAGGAVGELAARRELGQCAAGSRRAGRHRPGVRAGFPGPGAERRSAHRPRRVRRRAAAPRSPRCGSPPARR